MMSDDDTEPVPDWRKELQHRDEKANSSTEDEELLAQWDHDARASFEHITQQSLDQETAVRPTDIVDNDNDTPDAEAAVKSEDDANGSDTGNLAEQSSAIDPVQDNIATSHVIAKVTAEEQDDVVKLSIDELESNEETTNTNTGADDATSTNTPLATSERPQKVSSQYIVASMTADLLQSFDDGRADSAIGMAVARASAHADDLATTLTTQQSEPSTTTSASSAKSTESTKVDDNLRGTAVGVVFPAEKLKQALQYFQKQQSTKQYEKVSELDF